MIIEIHDRELAEPEALEAALRRAWESTPKYCPFCGGKNLYIDVALWSSVSEDDQNNKAVLDEHQCQDCGGRSFWA